MAGGKRAIHRAEITDRSTRDEAIVRAQSWVHQLTRRLLSYWSSDPNCTRESPRKHGALTNRENDVLHWIAAGKSNREMAEILGLSPGTVSKHLEHIFQKLGVENRTAAASFYRAPAEEAHGGSPPTRATSH